MRPVEKSSGLAEAAILMASAMLMLLLGGCHSAPELRERTVGLMAGAELRQVGGAGVLGRVTFKQDADFTRVELTVQGLSPGLHGIHVHEAKSCGEAALKASPDFSLGLHPHGAPAQGGAHAGDLGNVVVGADGTGRIGLNSPYLALEGPDSVVGLAFVVHEAPDDMKSQPDGLSGAPLACGLIAPLRP